MARSNFLWNYFSLGSKICLLLVLKMLTDVVCIFLDDLQEKSDSDNELDDTVGPLGRGVLKWLLLNDSFLFAVELFITQTE